MKQAYRTRDTLNSEGQYYDPCQLPDDAPEVQAPYVTIPIPDDIADKNPKFNYENRAWEDQSADAAAIREKQLQDDLTAAKQDAADAKATVEDLRAELQQTTDAVIELAQATLPSDSADSTETKQTESENTEGGAA